MIFDAALREEWLAGAADLRAASGGRRTPSACAGSTPTTAATASTSTRPRTSIASPPAPAIRCTGRQRWHARRWHEPERPSRAHAVVAADARARLRLGTAGRGLGRHRQLRAGASRRRGRRLCAGRAVAAGARRRRHRGHARQPAGVAARAGAVRGSPPSPRWACGRPRTAAACRVAGRVARLGGADGAGFRRGAQLCGWRSRAAPAPPIAAAALGALCAGARAGRPRRRHRARAGASALFVMAAAVLLVALQQAGPRCGRARRDAAPACSTARCRRGRRARGATRVQWPTLLAGLAMLPMMAALPLMAAWCRAESVRAAGHGAAALGGDVRPGAAAPPRDRRAGRRAACRRCARCCWQSAPRWRHGPRRRSTCWGWRVAHGAAWGVAWGGQLWAPARRGQQGTSPLRAAVGYAVLTLLFGLVVDRYGAHRRRGGACRPWLGGGRRLARQLSRCWAAPEPTAPPQGAANEVSVGVNRTARAFAQGATARTRATPAARRDRRAGGR